MGFLKRLGFLDRGFAAACSSLFFVAGLGLALGLEVVVEEVGFVGFCGFFKALGFFWIEVLQQHAPLFSLQQVWV